MQRTRSPYETILVIVLGFTGLYFIFRLTGLLYAAFGIGVVSLMSAYIRLTIIKLWEKLSLLLGKINGTLLLSLVFFLILTPLALLMRLAGKPQLQLRRKPGSYYRERNHTFSPSDLDKVF